MKKLFNLFVLFLSVSVLLTACGGGGGGGTTTTGGTTTIGTTTQGAQAASSGTQSSAMATGSSATFQSLGSIGLSGLVGAPVFKVPASLKLDKGMAKAVKLSGKFAKSRAAKATAASLKKARALKATTIETTSEACTDGGTSTYSGTINDDGSFTMTITFAQCREDETQFDGTMNMSGYFSIAQSGYIFTDTIGPFTMLEFENSYATLVSKISVPGLTITFSTIGTPSETSSIMSTTATGSINILDYLEQDSYSMTFTNFKNDVTSSTGTFSTTSNGSFSESWTEDSVSHSLSASFQSFKVDVTTSTDYEDTSISGTVTIDFTPDDCIEGTFSFVTQVPIRYDNIACHTIQGTIVINSNTTVQYNTDGSVDVTISGQSPKHYDSEYDLLNLCDFETFDEETPPSEGTGGGTTTGNTMTITSMSSNSDPNGNLDCFTDVHVNYYTDTVPTGTTTGTWYVDWHTGDVCTSSSGIAFEQGIDITDDGICDVGLDINGSDYDSTLGGLEHFTATTLPVGYYVVSINNWSCPTTVSNTVTISIGNSLFGPYNCTYTASDYEGTDPNAWCDVADIRVSDGTIEVLSHNSSLDLWHDGAFGMAAPMRAKRK